MKTFKPIKPAMKNNQTKADEVEKHFKRTFPVEKTEEEVRALMDAYIEKNQFVPSQKYSGQTYRSEKPNKLGFKYLRWSFQDGQFSLEAWVKGTMDIDWSMHGPGFLGYTIINPYRDSLVELIKKLKH